MATYFVPDRPCAGDTSNRAAASLPRNLTLKPSRTLKHVSHLELHVFLFSILNFKNHNFKVYFAGEIFSMELVDGLSGLLCAMNREI